MKKKDAIQKSMDDLGYQYQEPSFEQQQKDELQKRKDDARPALLKRIGAGLLDFLFAASFAGGLFVLAYFTIFPKVGYQNASQTLLNVYETSGLYLPRTENIGFDPLTSRYDDEKTPEQNYDVPITNFYSNNVRAYHDGELQKYIDRKVASGYYYIDENNECKRKENVNRDTAKNYLEKEYNIAIDYLFSDPELVTATRILNYSIPVTVLIVTIFGSAVFYFAIPLIDEKRRTLGYLIVRVMPVKSDDLTTPDRTRIALRSLMFVMINFISVITLGLFLNGTSYAFIPFFVNTVVICFSHSNSGLHDYGTKIIVINESYSNALSSLKQMIGQEGEEEHEYTLSKR